MRSKIESSKRYLIVAGATNLLAYFIFILIQYYLNPLQPVASAISAGFLVLPISFLLNRFWVFQSTNSIYIEFSKFISVYISSLFAGSLFLYALLGIISNPYFAQLIVIAVVGISSFTIHAFWTFINKLRD